MAYGLRPGDLITPRRGVGWYGVSQRYFGGRDEASVGSSTSVTVLEACFVS